MGARTAARAAGAAQEVIESMLISLPARAAPSTARASAAPLPAVHAQEPDWLECDQSELIQAQAQAWAHVLPALPAGPVPRLPVRLVNCRAYAALLSDEPLYAMAQALRQTHGDPLARVLGWLGRGLRRVLPGGQVPLALPPLGVEVAAFLPSRNEVVLCDDALPDPHAWSAALRAPLAMALLHQRAPHFLGSLSGQWATHIRYEAARQRLETSPELLLTQASRQNAQARWAWWSGAAALAATSQLAHDETAGWCQAVAKQLAAPAALLRKLVQLQQQDPVMLLRTLQDPLCVDALACGILDTVVFVPFGQTEITRQRIYDLERSATPNAALLYETVPVIEFAPLRGTPLDVRQAPVRAALQLLENGFCPQAVRLLEETLYLNPDNILTPDNIEALLALAELYLQQGLHELARGCYERVLSQGPGHRRALLGVQRVTSECTLAHPEAAVLRGLEWLIPAERAVLPRV